VKKKKKHTSIPLYSTVAPSLVGTKITGKTNRGSQHYYSVNPATGVVVANLAVVYEDNEEEDDDDDVDEYKGEEEDPSSPVMMNFTGGESGTDDSGTGSGNNKGGTKNDVRRDNSLFERDERQEENQSVESLNSVIRRGSAMSDIKEESQRSSFSGIEELNYRKAKKMISSRYNSSLSSIPGSSNMLARSIEGRSEDDEYQFDVNQNSMNTLNASSLTFNLHDSTQYFGDSTDTINFNDGTRKLKTGGDKNKTTNNDNDSDSKGGSSSSSQQHGGGRRWATWMQNEKVTKTLSTIQKLRRQCGTIINNHYLQLVMIVFILINALMMGVATFDFIKKNPIYLNAFDKTDEAFLIIFSIELVMQCIYHGHKLLFDGWLMFDLIIILMSWVFKEVQIIRAFRIFRAFRLITRIKIMRNLILALVNVMPRMAAIGLMLGLIFYIFAVMFTQLYSEADPGGDVFFGNIGLTLLTLFQVMTLDGWASIARTMMKTSKSAWLTFFVFVIISGFVIVNLIIAVICDAISSLDDDEKANLHGQYESDSDSSSRTPKMELREQLDSLEDQMVNITRIQARTFHTLQYLTQQLRTQKEAKEKANKLEKEGIGKSVPTFSKSNNNNKSKDEDERENYELSSNKGKSSSKPKRRRASMNSIIKNNNNNNNGNSNSNDKNKGSSQNNRVNYTQTWTQQGSQKAKRRASVSQFAQAARELQKLRDEEE